MSWAISTAFFSSVISTVLAVAALALNWGVPSVYLKIFLVAFVVRKWIATLMMADRALYRLPLNLTEPDPDIDEERHNGVAIYMSQLFTWHGYAMLIFGQFYVFFYASTHYLAAYPIITGVALGFACMGLVPFFALLSLLLLILLFLYFSYMVIYVILWPLSYWGLVQRQAISRMNGGYQSEGTTNTTDLNQVERSLEDAENGRGGGFGAVENLKLTPAMMAIPIVFYKKPGGRPVMTSPSAVAAMAAVTLTNTSSGQQAQQQQDQLAVTGAFPDGEQPVVLAMPQPRRFGSSHGRDTQNDALNRMSANLSIICSTPPAPSYASPGHGRSRSSTTNGSVMSSSNMSFIPCTSSGQVQEMTEVDAARRQPVSTIVSAATSPQNTSSSSPVANSGSGSGTGIVAQAAVTDATAGAGGYPMCVTAVVFPERHQRNYSTGQASNITNNSSAASHPEYSSAHDSAPTASASLPVVMTRPAIASLPAPPSIGTRSVTSSNTSSPSLLPLGSVAASAAASVSAFVAVSIAEESDDPPQSHQTPQAQEVQAQQEEFNNGDEECAICLSDFEDGDELRHLYCNHLFHRNCVDRWLVKNAFCPKCKRGI
ncbi:hypothetical protein BGZ88_002535 [Linnemannia elongata]|nr:hypothetical protein BGZ88_002535 [Linnemannia elongata]